MKRKRLAALAITIVSGAFLLIYVMVWSSIDNRNIGRSDFTSTYMGASLWSQGHHGDLYDESLQASAHAALIAPDQEGNLPFVNPPLAAVMAAPLTLLSLPAAYRIWSLLQLLMLAAAAVIAYRAASPAPTAGPWIGLAVIGVALAAPATLALLLLGQWDGLLALGIAATYRWLRADRLALAGFVLAVLSLLAKPHLALGVAGFVVGWRNRRLLSGALGGAVMVMALSLLAVGPAGLGGFIHAALGDASRWPLASLLGFAGFFGSWIGDPGLSQLLAGLFSLVAVAACVWLGERFRRGTISLEVGLGMSLVLSLLASPHLLMHDLVLLTPLAAWIAAAQETTPAQTWPDGRFRLLLGGWVVLAICEAMDFGNSAAAPPGRLVPIALIGLTVLILRSRTPAPLSASSVAVAS